MVDVSVLEDFSHKRNRSEALDEKWVEVNIVKVDEES